MIILILSIANIILAIIYNMLSVLLIPLVFMAVTYLGDCDKKSYLSPLLIGAIFIVAVGEMNLLYLLIVIPVLLFDIITSLSKQIESENNYIWELNNGPSSFERIKMIKGNDGEVEFYSWVGGVDGYYQGSGKKYDRNMIEISEGNQI